MKKEIGLYPIIPEDYNSINYVEIINFAINNIIDKRNIYIKINDKARIRIHIENLYGIEFYNVDSEILSENEYVSRATYSDSDFSGLRKLISLAWIRLEDFIGKVDI